MENPTHFASVARRLLPLVEAALALSRDEEVLNLLRSYGSNPAPVPDSKMSVSRPSLVGPSTRGQIRRRRNANPCTRCAASRQACRYVQDNPLRCSNCIDFDLPCVIRERRRARPVLAIDLGAITAPQMNRRVSSNQYNASSSPAIPGSAISQAPWSESERETNVAPRPSAPGPVLSTPNAYDSSPSYTLGAQPSNFLLPASDTEQFLPHAQTGGFPLETSQNGQQLLGSNSLQMFFSRDDGRDGRFVPGPSQTQTYQSYEYPFPLQ